MAKRAVIVSLILFFLVSNGCAALSQTSPPPGKLEILRHSMIKGESGITEVNVTVRNAGSATIGLALIEVNFYDSSGKIIETAEDSIAELKPNESWNFRIPCRGFGCEKIKDYEIKATAMTSSRR